MNWLFTAQHQLRYFTIAALLACIIALTAFGGAQAADGSGLSLQLLSDPANPTNTYPLSDAPEDAIRLIMVLKNISGQQINVERGLSQAELHRSLIVTDPCGNILELSPDAESFIFDAPPPRFVGGLPLIPAEILKPEFVRSLTIQDLRQLFPSMKKLPGTYRVTAQQTASRFVWTITDPNRGLQGVADHPANWFGTINAQEMRIYISPATGAQLEVTLTEADSQPLFQVPVKAFKTSEIPDGYVPADTWSTIEPILNGVTDTKGRTVWGACKTCVPADDYTIIAFYKDEFLVSEIAASDSGWNAGCSGLLTETIVYSEPSPPPVEKIIKISGGAYNSPEGGRYRATFSMDVSNEGPSPSGWLKYYYNRTRMSFVSTEITEVSGSDNSGIIKGKGTVNKVENYTFEAIVVDGSPDEFGITITGPSGKIYYSSATMNISAGDLTVSIE